MDRHVDDRAVHLAPFAGVEVRPGLDWLRIQLEGRWLSPTTDTRFAVVNWQGPNDMGAIAINLGVAIEFSSLFGGDNGDDGDDGDDQGDAVTTEPDPAPALTDGAQP